jgi:hypothetical protein
MKLEYTLLFSLILSTVISVIFLAGKPPKNYKYTGLLFCIIFITIFMSLYVLSILYRKFDIASKYDKDTIHLLYNKYWTVN